MVAPALVVSIAFVFTQTNLASADSFLQHQHARTVSLRVRSEELQAALGAIWGCTDGDDSFEGPARVTELQEDLMPVWRTLPKNQQGRVEWKVVRYMVHRHFMHRFGIMVRGMEPSIQVNESSTGEAAIFSSQTPDIAQQILKGPHVEEGFLLKDAAAMVAALEHLIFTSERALLERLYQGKGFGVHDKLPLKDLQALIKDYMVYWLMGEDEEGAAEVVQQPHMLPQIIPHWDTVVSMAEGSVRALEFSRQQSPRPGSAPTVLSGLFTFEDALTVSGDISRNFAFFWDSQCQNTKEPLTAMDKSGTGRVRLSDFYGANKEGEWRFGESEAYLKELGALDETSTWRGKQVLIPNYLQAASNCIATRAHYLVCCVNECEDILGQLEAALQGPIASPEEVLQALKAITNGDDEPAKLTRDLKRQLQSIAKTHGNKVPLHGRLFAQWLHYAFPRECPFPHKAGTAAALTPSQFGENFAVSPEEVNKHLAEEVIKKDLEGSSAHNASVAMQQWMTQWSEEEELIGDYSLQIQPSWGMGPVIAMSGAAAAAVAMIWVGSSKAGGGGSSFATHSHFV